METILVVEDDAGVRAVLCEMLGGHGYSVVAAATEDEAAALVDGRRIDLVVLDLMLPRARVDLRSVLPSARYVYISGYGPERLPRRLPFGSTFVQKPFTSEELLASVRLALAAG